MEEFKSLNMELRSFVIGNVLRLEQTSTDAIRAILRMFKKNSKTLGNQSSAFSFKTKIDLLYDLGELDKTHYLHLLKLMEIRNQFAHNVKATSFVELDKINPSINKHLSKYTPKEIEKKIDRESILILSFFELFKITAAKLLIIENEYHEGIQKEIRKYINDAIIENIDQIWNNVLAKYRKNNITTTSLFMMSMNNNEIDQYYHDFKISISDFAKDELHKIEDDKLKAVFKQKTTTTESIAERRAKKKSTK